MRAADKGSLPPRARPGATKPHEAGTVTACRSATLRTFIALPAATLAEPLTRRLERARRADLRWVPAVNWHVTLRFLGATDAAHLEALTRLLERAADGPAFELRLESVGWFPSDRKRIALAASVADDARLSALQAILERGAVELGFAPEARAFRPHLTLGRPPRRRAAPDFTPLILDLPLAARELVLYESTGAPRGVRYRALARAPLGGWV